MRVSRVVCSGGKDGKAILRSCTGGVFFLASLYLVATQPHCKDKTDVTMTAVTKIEPWPQGRRGEAFIT
jgi:hypothetical protein